MKKTDGFDEMREFDFSKARRITAAERRMFRQAYKNTFGVPMPRRGRPPKQSEHKYHDVHMKIHPKALKWAKARARQRRIGYQTVINEILLKHAA